MVTTPATTELTEPIELEIGSGGPPRGGNEGGGGGEGGPRRRALPRGAYRLGMTFGLASIAMFFIGLTSSYIVRHGLDPDWQAIQMPPVLLVNTVILLASSFALEMARRALNASRGSGLGQHLSWLRITLLLGVGFMCGQFMAWRYLLNYGIGLSTSAHSSFFYLLTGLHGFHLLGGIVAMSYLTGKARRTVAFAVAAPGDPGAPTYSFRAFDVIALYWHSMDILWLFLMVVLFGEIA